MELEVIDVVLPQQELIVTQWFHSDCLADYYGCEVFSGRYWQIVESFMKTAAQNGINMILTPIFTPPLDTEIGSERPTVQLVDIAKDESGYTFNFDKLKRWIDMAHASGIRYFEMAHLFSQWGAKCTPKIIVTENGEPTKKFGWHVSADDKMYTEFLKSFLPALTEFFDREGISENVYFHISDEPHLPDKDHYRSAKSIVKPLIGSCKTMDALSDYELYREGLVDTPDRIARMYTEIFSGKEESAEEILSKRFQVDNSECVLEKDIVFYSMCEHHLMPFYGKAHIAYIPNGEVVGLSKLARTVECYARRLQLQEQLSAQVADAIMEHLNPKGVMVVMEAEHMCMTMRGVKKPGSKTVTVATRGVFESDPAARDMFFRMLQTGA